jgi:hypothetical protein
MNELDILIGQLISAIRRTQKRRQRILAELEVEDTFAASNASKNSQNVRFRQAEVQEPSHSRCQECA